MKSPNKKIILTGGGTAGHVTPNLALVPLLKNAGYDILYIGSYSGIEKELVQRAGLPYKAISAGKLRRYASFKNITDTARVIKGLADAKKIIKDYKPDIIFSKGGFVSVPVVIAGKMSGVPVVIHESDTTPGLANKMSIPFAKAVCVTFPETKAVLTKKKVFVTGSPIRSELYEGQKSRGLEICGFDGKKPVLFVMGGSSGSVKINACLLQSLDELTPHFDIVHICGKGNKSRDKKAGYAPFEYINDELAHIFAAADVVVSRAGSNSVCEIAALEKPNVLIPLSLKASRGDQILNAASFEKRGFSDVLPEEELSLKTFVSHVMAVYNNRGNYITAMGKNAVINGSEEVLAVIKKFTK